MTRSLRHGSIACLTLAVVALSTPAPAHAYKFAKGVTSCDGTPTTISLAHRWTSLPVTYSIWAGSAAPDATESIVVTATQNAFNEWINRTTSDFTASPAGFSTTGKLGNAANEVIWIQSDWYASTGSSQPGAGNILGLTFTISDRFTGKLSDAQACPPIERCGDTNPCPATESDIFFNAEYSDGSYDWSTAASPSSLAFAVLTHEVGHFLGLGHEQNAGSDGKAPIMSASPVPLPSVSIIRADDDAGAAALYPPNAAACETDGDCVSGNWCSIGASCPLAGAYCEAVTECPRAERCLDGVCEDSLAGAGAPCFTETEKGVTCGDGLTCEAPDGFFKGRCTGPCSADEDCAPVGVCRTPTDGSEEKECVFPGIFEAGEACSSHNECLSTACVDGTCARACASDADCEDPNGQWSDGPACQSGACVPRTGDTPGRSAKASGCSVHPASDLSHGRGTAWIWATLLTLGVVRRRRGAN